MRDNRVLSEQEEAKYVSMMLDEGVPSPVVLARRLQHVNRVFGPLNRKTHRRIVVEQLSEARRVNRGWSEDQVSILRQYFPDLNECTARLGKSAATCHRKAILLGLRYS